jgi:hypothetical protein
MWSIGATTPSPGVGDPELLWAAWRAAADEVWATSKEVRRAAAAEREVAYAHHLAALKAEAICATDLALLAAVTNPSSILDPERRIPLPAADTE